MKRVSLMIFLLVLVLGSVYANAQVFEVGGDLQFSSYSFDDGPSRSVMLINLNGAYELNSSINAFGTFSFGTVPEKEIGEWIYYKVKMSKFKVGGEYAIPFNTFTLKLRGGLTTYTIDWSEPLKTSALFFGGKVQTQATSNLMLYGQFDYSPFAKASYGNSDKEDAKYANFELGANYSLGKIQLVGGFRSEAIGLKQYTDNWGDGGLFIGAITSF